MLYAPRGLGAGPNEGVDSGRGFRGGCAGDQTLLRRAAVRTGLGLTRRSTGQPIRRKNYFYPTSGGDQIVSYGPIVGEGGGRVDATRLDLHRAPRAMHLEGAASRSPRIPIPYRPPTAPHALMELSPSGHALGRGAAPTARRSAPSRAPLGTARRQRGQPERDVTSRCAAGAELSTRGEIKNVNSFRLSSRHRYEAPPDRDPRGGGRSTRDAAFDPAAARRARCDPGGGARLPLLPRPRHAELVPIAWGNRARRRSTADARASASSTYG